MTCPTWTVAASPCAPLTFTVSGFGSPPSLLHERSPLVSTEGVKVTPFLPSAPGAPSCPFVPGVPVAPRGMVNFKIAAFSVPVFSTLAFVPGVPVMTSPICIVAAAPSCPLTPSLPSAPLVPSLPSAPVAPRGMVKLRMAALSAPTLVTLA